MSANDVVPNCSPVRMSSSVWFAAPFIVMPSENDALSGDTKTFESFCARLTRFHSANENAFDALSTPRSADVRSRGSAVSAGATAVGFVAPFSLHAASATMTASENRRENDSELTL